MAAELLLSAVCQRYRGPAVGHFQPFQRRAGVYVNGRPGWLAAVVSHIMLVMSLPTLQCNVTPERLIAGADPFSLN